VVYPGTLSCRFYDHLAVMLRRMILAGASGFWRMGTWVSGASMGLGLVRGGSEARAQRGTDRHARARSSEAGSPARKRRGRAGRSAIGVCAGHASLTIASPPQKNYSVRVLKRCSKCGKDLPSGWYCRNGDGRFAAACRTCRKGKSSDNAARRRKAVGRHTQGDVEWILRKQGHRCVLCGASLWVMFHVDHIVPICRGGSNWPSNLQCLCPGCNLEKGGR
jgi:5-methylcytosine-specific restriction endonuclease McrA